MCVFPSVVLKQPVQKLYMATYISAQHRNGRMELLRCCFGWQRLPLDVCVCDNRWGGACNAASGHRCVCQLQGTTQCHATDGHACTCKSTHDAHACLANEHVCVCPQLFPYYREWNINCRARQHPCKCFCDPHAAQQCGSTQMHRCICANGGACFAARHECTCHEAGAAKCRATGFHQCLCATRGRENCRCVSLLKGGGCPCTCTTAGDNSACRARGDHKCACRYIVSGTAMPSIDASVCRVPPGGVHAYYSTTIHPPPYDAEKT
jgi:hypothetical protein